MFGGRRVDRPGGDGGTHIGQHHECYLLGLIEGVQVTLKVVFLEDEGFSVDFSLTVLGIETQQLLGERKRST